MNSFDEHNCGYKEACKKEIMEYISSEIENLIVEYLATRTIRDTLFQKENIKIYRI